MNKISEYLKYINEQIVSIIEEALKAKTINKYDAKEAASYTLDIVNKSKGPMDLLISLRAMALSWPVFKNLVKSEEGKAARLTEQQMAKNVAILVKTGHTEKALRIAKTTMGDK